MKCESIRQRLMRMFFGALFAFLLSLNFSGIASAAVRTVTNLYDAGSGSLRNVLTEAISGDSIVFDAGLSGTILMTHGALAIAKDLSIDGGNRITLSGEELSRIFTVTNASLTLSNLSLINGTPPNVDEEFQADIGGALYLDATSGSRTLTLNNCRVSRNKGWWGRGAVFANKAGSAESLTVNVTDCVLNNNATGGLYVDAQHPNQGEVTVNVTDSKFIANAGSGIGTHVNDLASTVTIMNSLIDGNGFPGGIVWGVGISAYWSAQVTFLMDGCTVSNNTGGNGGVGLNVYTTNDASTITVRKSRFISNVNTATYSSGGVSLSNNSIGGILVENCFFSSNISAGDAGALKLYTKSGTIRITNNTVFGNSAQLYGGGVVIRMAENDAAVNFYNNIIYGNTLTEGTLGKDIYIDDEWKNEGEGDGIGAYALLSHNIFGPGTQDVYPEIGDNTHYNSNITQDPNLVNPSGGDLHLKASSPAIDAGISAYLRFVYRRIAPYDDIDGDARTPFGEYESCDIGADEYTARTGGNLPAVMLLLLEDD